MSDDAARELAGQVSRIAWAIARAEGFLVAGSRPKRNHNPGNLTQDLTGKAIGRDGLYVIYATDEDGLEALKKQVGLMLSGKSKVYKPTMTILEVAERYTTTEQEDWARNVARGLGVSIRTPLKDV